MLFSPIAATMRLTVLGQSDLTIGRDAECSIVLDDMEVSRCHARLEPLDQGAQLIDLDSANGVFVNGARVSQQSLRGGEVLRIGTSLLRYLEESPQAKSDDLKVSERGLVGGPALAPTRRLLERAAASDLSVLLAGETGTGKEVAATLIHSTGDRRAGPLVAVNCAAIPKEMLESELFGHTKGAFTDATQDRTGLISQAHGGVLFLDEIGELAPASQAKLLRVLEDRRVRPLGGDRAEQVDLQLICATNRDLGAQVALGEFRADLYARIADLTVTLPPLRQRPEEIPLLLRHFLRQRGEEARELAVEVLEYLCCRPWPFNVRQLRRALQRALALAGDDPVRVEHLLLEDGTPAAGAEPVACADPQAAELVEALRRCEGNALRAAKELGVSRSALYRRAQKFGIIIETFRQG